MTSNALVCQLHVASPRGRWGRCRMQLLSKIFTTRQHVCQQSISQDGCSPKHTRGNPEPHTETWRGSSGTSKTGLLHLAGTRTTWQVVLQQSHRMFWWPQNFDLSDVGKALSLRSNYFNWMPNLHNTGKWAISQEHKQIMNVLVPPGTNSSTWMSHRESTSPPCLSLGRRPTQESEIMCSQTESLQGNPCPLQVIAMHTSLPSIHVWIIQCKPGSNNGWVGS